MGRSDDWDSAGSAWAHFTPTRGMERYADACCTQAVAANDAGRCKAANISPATLARWRGRPGFEDWLNLEVRRVQASRAWEVLEMLRRVALTDESAPAAKAFLERCKAPESNFPQTFAELALAAESTEDDYPEPTDPPPIGYGGGSDTVDGVSWPKTDADTHSETPAHAEACKSVQDCAATCAHAQGDAESPDAPPPAAPPDVSPTDTDNAAAPPAPALSREEMWARRMERGEGIFRERKARIAARRAAARGT